MKHVTAALLVIGLGACAPAEEKPLVNEYQAQIEQWHAARDARLRAPEGWLSLVGLHWVEPGTHRLGSGADNDIVLNTGPASLGQLRLHEGLLYFTAAPESGASIDGVALNAETVLPPDSSGNVTKVVFNAGQASFQVIERGGRFGLRVRDAAAPSRTGFAGIEHFPIDSGWRYEATWQPHPAGRTLDIATVLNTIEPMSNTGAIVFERDGKTHRLEVVDEGGGALFVIFSDRTNGRETYGAGRFVYAEPLDADRVVLDFNKAYNPPCALNAYSTCPLPPPENRLDLAVTAGEKNGYPDSGVGSLARHPGADMPSSCRISLARHGPNDLWKWGESPFSDPTSSSRRTAVACGLVRIAPLQITVLLGVR